MKQAIRSMDKADLVRIVTQLYDKSATNRRIIEAHLNPTEALDDFIKTVEALMGPNQMRRPRIAEAKRMISGYRRSTGDKLGEIELTLRFLECGNEFTVLYGDIDGPFYDSLVTTYEKAIEYVAGLPPEEQEPFRERLRALVEASSKIGWGYHDALVDAFQNAFPDTDA